MELCGTCRDFFDRTLTIQELEYQALYSRLCQKLYDFLKVHYESSFDLPDPKDSSLAILVLVEKSQLHGDENRFSSVKFFCRLNDHKQCQDLAFSIWANEGSPGLNLSTIPSTTGIPALESFVTWPPIFQGSTEETSSLVRKFLHNCLDHHESCRLSHPEEELELPSRVLSIKDDAGVISVRLAQNDGLKGKYCALSHCWGPTDKRPLRTLQCNIMDHLASINWDKLPATFRDAITLTKNLGINYLWIDSLCIIQDDKKDWLDESMKMASIYQRATLVIAAASSEDSTQGLSNPERPESLTLRVPRYIKETSSRAVYNIAESIDTGIGIDGPLKKRAWAFQEWYLGRRKVFFTSKGIKWNCDGMECNERASPTELMLWETMSWKHCLQEYTSKLLTVPSDRLVALRGIVAEIQKSRNDLFVPEFGVWEDKLAEQILWRPTDMKHEDLAGLPSWCWAATGGGKSWLISKADNMFGETTESTVNTVNLRSSGSVNASGLLIKFTMAPLPLRECCVQHFENQYRPEKELPLESVILPSWTEEHFNIRRYLILNPRGKSDFLGIAIFDRCVFFSECFCLILASTRRLALTDPCHPDYGKNSSRKEEGRSSGKENSDSAFQKSSVEEEGDDLDAENDGNDDFNAEHGSLSGEQHCPIQVQDTSTGFEESGVKESKQSYPGYVHRDTDACVDILNVARSEEVHWALLLQPVDDTLKRYTRVGVALLWPRALEKGEGEFTEFEIV